MNRGLGLFAIVFIGCAVLFGLLTVRGTLPLVLVPVWVVAGVVLIEVRRRRLYNKLCPRCGLSLLGTLKGGIGAPKACQHCSAVLEWDEELQPLDTGETAE